MSHKKNINNFTYNMLFRQINFVMYVCSVAQIHGTVVRNALHKDGIKYILIIIIIIKHNN